MLPYPAPDTCWLYLVRHGATGHNLSQPPLLQGRSVDLSLSDVGRNQAEQTAAFLSSAQLSAIYCSDLRRARETAQLIATPHGLSLEIRPEIVEVDVGHWENRSWLEISQTEPEAFERFLADAGTHGYGGGENLTQVLERAQPLFDRILPANLGRSIAVVGHNVVNRVWLSHVLGLPLARSRFMLQDNCCLNLIRYRHGEAVVAVLNSTFHLQHI
jgi:broad specificity phosphatase PhoE